MDLGNYFAIIIGAIFINNFVLARFLGMCSFIGISKRIDSAFSMGMAVTFVMTMTSVFCWIVFTYLLNPVTNVFHGTDLTFLRTLIFITVIAGLVQFTEMVIQKTSPVLYNVMGIYLPLITTNCAVLGVALLNQNESYGFLESTINGIAGGVGYTLAMILMGGLREKLDTADIPTPLKGVPIAFITASLMAMAFMAFSGFVLS
jgi:electron transport complex protein RnfA